MPTTHNVSTEAGVSLLKQCADCGEDKPHDDFYRYARGTLYSRCKPCHYVRTQAWRSENREKLRELDRDRYRDRYRDKIRARKRERKYGITQDQYDEMLARQMNVCPICLEPFSESRDAGDWFIPAVDHDHETGRVRGILHRRCNLAIEFLMSDGDIARARRYLEPRNQEST